MTQRNGDWMQTFTGKQFWTLDPRPSEISIVDIAAALSKACRYAGHCLRFYSVAEHCVLMHDCAVSRGYDARLCRAALLHDASEAYLTDIPRPIKPSLTGYHAVEDRLMRVIAGQFDFDWPVPASIKHLDDAILIDEMRQNMAPPPADWNLTERDGLGVRLRCWTPDVAFAELLRAAAVCGVA